MPTGPRATDSLVMLTGWDATALQNFTLEDGTTYAQVVAEMNAALGALNSELANDPLWASLLSFTDMPEVEYRVGSSNGFELHTEYGLPDQKRAATEGHMLPLLPYDRMLGWTWDYLRRARLSQIRADIADAITDARSIWRQKVLTRILQRGDDSGAAKGLGSSGYSAGFATTAASTSVDFTPPSVNGNTFASTHEHYVAIAGGAFTEAVFTDAFDELREHGHEAPFDFLVGPSDRATVIGLTGMAQPYAVGYQAASTTAISTLDPSVYICTYKGLINVREVPGIPQYYGFAYKSYGPRSQRNPLRVRLGKGISAPNVVAMPDPRAGNGTSPLQNLMLFTEFGVGVADRTAGTPRYVNNASWSDGTAT